MTNGPATNKIDRHITHVPAAPEHKTDNELMIKEVKKNKYAQKHVAQSARVTMRSC